jgi:hypothetical protein
MPKPPFLSIARILERDPKIASWAARMKQEEALTVLIRRHLPRPLAGRVRVAGSRNRVLELAVEAGAVATVVRQPVPELTSALRREGADFTEIRIRVQVRAERGKPQLIPRQLDAEAARLFDLGARLPEGPLKSALARWSRRVRGR